MIDLPVSCIVAEFDILGFKEIILNPPKDYMDLKNIADSYEMYFTKNIYNSKQNLNYRSKYQIFSDTAITYMEYIDQNGDYLKKPRERIYEFFRHLCIVMVNSIFAFSHQDFFANRISEFPIRGGISIGRIIVKNMQLTSPVLMGKPIISAYEWEQQQNWLGLSINPEDIEEIKNTLSLDMYNHYQEENYWNKLINENILVEYDVPTKIGLIKTWVINFVPNGKENDIIKELKKELNKYKGKNCKSVYSKYYATKQFVEFIARENKFINPNLLTNGFSNL